MPSRSRSPAPAAAGASSHEMNAKARELGMRAPTSRRPSGVVDRGNYSTAWDMAALARYALRNPRFAKVVATRRVGVKWSAPTYAKIYVNKNQLLGTYRGADGVKTGWTTLARHCLVASAHRGNVRLIAVVLHSENPFGDARRLLNLGFRVRGYADELLERRLVPDRVEVGVPGGELAGQLRPLDRAPQMLDRVGLSPGEALAAREVVGQQRVLGVGVDDGPRAVGGLGVLARLVEGAGGRPELPAAGLVGLPGRAADRDERRVRLLRERRPPDAGRGEDERPGGRVDPLAVELEGRAAAAGRGRAPRPRPPRRAR